ncbi:hypothetical protein [Pseudoalteromonas rubra]|uniref:Uncharacterized protein n=1 Tax=Pseudoalteromonas rubra TaxID=43658 RepID=A0A0U2X8E4_9GAMM|nr:hypothetical protein [Pseudoalteromonas rubra]ALU44196.1 hypothetical protein AT705_15300 [Pseudoalteromonas rubra]
MDHEPGYTAYSLEELIDVYNHIDRARFPYRFIKILRLLKKDLRAYFTAGEINKYAPESLLPEQAHVRRAEHISNYFESFHVEDSGSDSSDAGSSGSDSSDSGAGF